MGRARQCDRCDEFYPCSDGWYNGEIIALRTMEVRNFGVMSQNQGKNWDLCPKCTAKLNQWLKGKDFKEN